MIYEYWLSGFGYSGRGVRYRQLSADEIDDIAKEAAMGGAGMTAIAYHIETQSIGTRRMIVAYTEPLEPGADGAEPDLEAASWKPVDATVMEISFGKGTIFTTKDAALLNKFYSELHEVRVDEAQRAMGKVKARAR